MRAPRQGEVVNVQAAGRIILVRATSWEDLRYELPRPAPAERRDAHARARIEAIARATNQLADDELLDRLRLTAPADAEADVIKDELERRGYNP